MRSCPSFPGYSVNEDGEVFSHRCKVPICGPKYGSKSVIKHTKAKRLMPQTHKKGYLTVVISKDSKIRPIGVHALVADAFLGPNPGGLVVRHLDDNPANNHPTNLAYGTHKDNAADRKRNGGYKSGGYHHSAKLTNEQAETVKKLRKAKWKVRAIAEYFHVSVACIESIIYSKAYKSFERTEKPE